MNTKYKNILIVDDEEDLIDILEFKLEDLDVNTISANNGAFAFEIIENTDIDLIITDICMAGCSGVELCKMVKESKFSAIPIIFVTGFSDYSIDELYNVGAQSVFTKPINYSALIDEVDKTIINQNNLWNRKYIRPNANSEVSLSIESLDKARTERVLNFGMGGMFIQMDKQLPKVNELINFKIGIKVPEYMALEGQAIVRWVRVQADENNPAGIGVEFDSLSDTTISKLRVIINSIVTQSYIPSC